MSDVCDIVASPNEAALETVIDVWQRVLQRAPIGADDNFFDLGGDSLLAIQLFAELERVSGRQFPITTVYDASTPAELAMLLDAPGSRPAFSPLVLLNEGAAGHDPASPPIFLLHGIGGNVMELAQLGRSIGPHSRVFAIQARGLDGVETAIDSIPAMAEYYLEAVRAKQSNGPYVLIGYSFGGMVAMEMARRIEEAGESIAFLGFIDSYPHPTHWPLISWLDVRWRRMAYSARTKLRARVVSRLSRLVGRSGAATGRRGAEALARPFLFDEDWPEAVRHVYDTSLRALSAYKPYPYAGSVAFFRAETRSFYLPDRPERMWGGLLGGLEVVTVPGDHVAMVGLNAATLGAQIAHRVAAGLSRVRRDVA